MGRPINLTYFYLPKSARAYTFFHQSVKIVTCSATQLVLTPFCPQPNACWLDIGCSVDATLKDTHGELAKMIADSLFSNSKANDSNNNNIDIVIAIINISAPKDERSCKEDCGALSHSICILNYTISEYCIARLHEGGGLNDIT